MNNQERLEFISGLTTELDKYGFYINETEFWFQIYIKTTPFGDFYLLSISRNFSLIALQSKTKQDKKTYTTDVYYKKEYLLMYNILKSYIRRYKIKKVLNRI